MQDPLAACWGSAAVPQEISGLEGDWVCQSVCCILAADRCEASEHPTQAHLSANNIVYSYHVGDADRKEVKCKKVPRGNRTWKGNLPTRVMYKVTPRPQTSTATGSWAKDLPSWTIHSGAMVFKVPHLQPKRAQHSLLQFACEDMIKHISKLSAKYCQTFQQKRASMCVCRLS